MWQANPIRKGIYRQLCESDEPLDSVAKSKSVDSLVKSMFKSLIAFQYVPFLFL